MSVESAEAFVTRMREDKSFRNKMSAFQDPESLIIAIKEEGYEFTKAEIQEVPLTDEELDKVVGGSGNSTLAWVVIKTQPSDSPTFEW